MKGGLGSDKLAKDLQQSTHFIGNSQLGSYGRRYLNDDVEIRMVLLQRGHNCNTIRGHVASSELCGCDVQILRVRQQFFPFMWPENDAQMLAKNSLRGHPCGG